MTIIHGWAIVRKNYRVKDGAEYFVTGTRVAFVSLYRTRRFARSEAKAMTLHTGVRHFALSAGVLVRSKASTAVNP